MLPLTVLSPHRDDAAFSLCLALSRWSERNVEITVVNFFTASSYAPHSAATGSSAISLVREREDRDALASIHPAIRIDSFGLLDAPLRLGISAAAICAPDNINLQPEAEISALALLIRPYLAQGLVFAPLALGSHIDHNAVRRAATSLSQTERLGFYEDLPYATWISDDELKARVEDIERATGLTLEPTVITANEAVESKSSVVSRYASQITAAEAEAIAGYSLRYGGGERIWTPKAGKLWRFLIQ